MFVKLGNNNIVFTSDFHMDHAKIIEYSKRPFKNVVEMNEKLIRNFNSKVKPDTKVFYLGDFCFSRDSARWEELIRRLNGEIYFIKGNHDHYKVLKEIGHMFKWVGDYLEVEVPDQDFRKGKNRITLCHYAMRVWNKSHHGNYQLFGHSHNSLPDDPNSLSIDVGVDAHNYFPLTYKEIKAIMAKKTFKPIDHHGRKDDEPIRERPSKKVK